MSGEIFPTPSVSAALHCNSTPFVCQAGTSNSPMLHLCLTQHWEGGAAMMNTRKLSSMLRCQETHTKPCPNPTSFVYSIRGPPPTPQRELLLMGGAPLASCPLPFLLLPSPTLSLHRHLSGPVRWLPNIWMYTPSLSINPALLCVPSVGFCIELLSHVRAGTWKHSPITVLSLTPWPLQLFSIIAVLIEMATKGTQGFPFLPTLTNAHYVWYFDNSHQNRCERIW